MPGVGRVGSASAAIATFDRKLQQDRRVSNLMLKELLTGVKNSLEQLESAHLDVLQRALCVLHCQKSSQLVDKEKQLTRLITLVAARVPQPDIPPRELAKVQIDAFYHVVKNFTLTDLEKLYSMMRGKEEHDAALSEGLRKAVSYGESIVQLVPARTEEIRTALRNALVVGMQETIQATRHELQAARTQLATAEADLSGDLQTVKKIKSEYFDGTPVAARKAVQRLMERIPEGAWRRVADLPPEHRRDAIAYLSGDAETMLMEGKRRFPSTRMQGSSGCGRKAYSEHRRNWDALAGYCKGKARAPEMATRSVVEECKNKIDDLEIILKTTQPQHQQFMASISHRDQSLHTNNRHATWQTALEDIYKSVVSSP